MNQYFQIIASFSINVYFISHHALVFFTFSLSWLYLPNGKSFALIH